MGSSTHSPFTNFLPLGQLHFPPTIFPPLHVILFSFLGLELSGSSSSGFFLGSVSSGPSSSGFFLGSVSSGPSSSGFFLGLVSSGSSSSGFFLRFLLGSWSSIWTSSQVDVSLLNVCPSGQVVFTSQVDVSWLKTNPSSQNFSHF